MQNNINALNIVEIGKILFEDKDIRKYIINNDKQNLLKKTEIILNKINYINIEDHILNDNNMYIDFSYKYESNKNKDDIKIFLRQELRKSNLLFKDLILLLLDNFHFSKNIFQFKFSLNYHLGFLNKLNYIYYNLAIFLNATREELYYCSLYLLKSFSINRVLLPKFHSTTFNNFNCDFETANLVYSSVIKGMHYIYPYYYIEIFDYNYYNSQKSIHNYKTMNDKRKLIIIGSVLKTSDKRRFQTYLSIYIKRLKNKF